MKLFDIIKKVGGFALKAAVPGGGLLVDAVNVFLKDGDKLPSNATGHDVQSAIGRLPVSEQAELMNKEFDVEITEIKEGNATIRTMLENENGESTRPRIALGCFRTISFCNCIIVLIWAYAVTTANDKLITSIAGSWEFIAAINAPLVAVLLSYFGNLVREKKNRLDAVAGVSVPSGIVGVIGSLFKK